MAALKHKKTLQSKPAHKAQSRKSSKSLKFDIDQIPASVKKSPLKLKEWLDSHIPALIGPRIDSLDPPSGQRGTILSIRGAYFSTIRTDNQVTIGGVSVPVVAATASELRVLVTKDVDSGPVEVSIGSSTSAGPHDFTIDGYPGGADDGPPVFAEGAGSGSAGDVNPIGTIRVLVV
ncbi:MAG: IPT/TIG domain-containing protein, partial [Acidobacteriota bacterium]